MLTLARPVVSDGWDHLTTVYTAEGEPIIRCATRADAIRAYRRLSRHAAGCYTGPDARPPATLAENLVALCAASANARSLANHPHHGAWTTR